MWYGGRSTRESILAGFNCRTPWPWPCLLWLRERANINYSPYTLWFGESRESWSHGKPSTRSVFPLVSVLPIGQTQESTREPHCHLSSNCHLSCVIWWFKPLSEAQAVGREDQGEGLVPMMTANGGRRGIIKTAFQLTIMVNKWM